MAQYYDFKAYSDLTMPQYRIFYDTIIFEDKVFKYSRLKEAKEKWQFNAVFDPILTGSCTRGGKCYERYYWIE